VILFQEQILEIAMVLGGYTPSQADSFRRAMNRHRSITEMAALRDGFLEAVRRTSGVEEELGSELFKSISGFAEFGFCRCLAGDTVIADPLSGRSATLQEMAEISHLYSPTGGGGTLLAPPVAAVLSLGPDNHLHPAAITALYRNGVHRTYRVTSRSGRAVTTTGNHPFLTPSGYRQLDDLAAGCEVALQWSGGDIFWDRISSIEDAGEQETFDLTVEPHHNFVAGGFVVHNSHAAAFARTTYETVWLKNNHPAAYYCGLLNNQPMGFYHPAVLVEDAKRHGVRVLPVDINLSRERCLPEGRDAFRLGFNYVRAVGHGALERIRIEREHGEFTSLENFCDRVCTPVPPALLAAAESLVRGRVRMGHPGTSLNPRIPAQVKVEAVENLVMVGAFDFLGVPRRNLLWKVRGAVEDAGKRLLVTPSAEVLDLPGMTELEVTSSDYRVLDLTTGRHIVSYYREMFAELGVTNSRDLKHARNESRVRVAGLVITRQAPGTAKRFRFFTLEDEYGHINLILKPDFFAANRAVALQNDLLMFEGTVQHVDNTLSIRATAVRALPPPPVAPSPRNFR
jgi:DNA polymerase III alpha subunit